MYNDLNVSPFLFYPDVLEAWGGKTCNVLLSKISAYKLFYWDIKQLGPDMELESEVLQNGKFNYKLKKHMFFLFCEWLTNVLFYLWTVNQRLSSPPYKRLQLCRNYKINFHWHVCNDIHMEWEDSATQGLCSNRENYVKSHNQLFTTCKWCEEKLLLLKLEPCPQRIM